MSARHDRPTALVISPTPVLPVLGGASARVQTLLDSLDALGFDVHFAFIERDEGDKPAMRETLGDRFHPIPYRKPRVERSPVLKAVRAGLRKLGIDRGWLSHVDELYDRSVDHRLALLHKRWRFDVVVAEYIFFSRALRVFGSESRKLIDMHDVFGNRHQLYLKQGRTPEWLSVRPVDELRALRRADHVIAIQEDEAARMRAAGIVEISAVSHIVRLESGDTGRWRAGARVLFVGSGNEANRVGLRWFLDSVWPLVLRRVPIAQLDVAGAVGQGLTGAPGVKLLGRVSNDALDALYANAVAAVNPVFTGSGQSIKVLEATGRGVPVVATRVGVRGIGQLSEPAVHVCDDAADFAAALTGLLLDPELSASARAAASQFAAASNRLQLESLARACGIAAAGPLQMPEQGGDAGACSEGVAGAQGDAAPDSAAAILSGLAR